MEKEKNPLSLEALCTIIEKCAEHSVENFKFQDLEISFKAKENSNVPQIIHGPSQVPAPLEIIDTEKEYEEETRFQKEEDFSTLHIEDPLLYEQMISDPELLEKRIAELEGEDGAET